MSHPLSYLATAGAAGDPVTALGWGLGWVCVAVTVVVVVALVGGLARRRPPADARDLAVPRDAGGLGWIYTGVAVTAVVLAGCAAWTMLTVHAIAMPSAAAAVTVQVTGAQWWWRMRYEDPDASRVFTTANELHIPAGRPVRVELASEDVIHSFWIPRLAGKIDMIPGQTNVMWLHANEPGVYRGQCGEFCGAQHAHMALEVVADKPEDFARWRDAQAQPAVVPSDPAVQAGAREFVSHCGACHSVRGTDAGGVLGPDLTHLMSRRTLAAGALPNDAGHLAEWITRPQEVKPGTRMPDTHLTPAQVGSIAAWLQTLR